MKSGINQEESKEITKLIKDHNKKIQTSFQNKLLELRRKKRRPTKCNYLLKESNIKTPLSYINFEIKSYFYIFKIFLDKYILIIKNNPP